MTVHCQPNQDTLSDESSLTTAIACFRGKDCKKSSFVKENKQISTFHLLGNAFENKRLDRSGIYYICFANS